jgi:hypothetical protein|nr:MAG TPA: hypothetical protein [Siphoviridae sp. ctRJB2]
MNIVPKVNYDGLDKLDSAVLKIVQEANMRVYSDLERLIFRINHILSERDGKNQTDGGVTRCVYTSIDSEEPHRPGDTYWYLSNMGVVLKKTWMLSPDDIRRHRIGNTYRTKEECEKARDRQLAEVRLRQTSMFTPDFENRNGGWIVVYNYAYHKLFAENIRFEDAGEPVRYETEEDAKRSIKENREDWLTYFGIREVEK